MLRNLDSGVPAIYILGGLDIFLPPCYRRNFSPKMKSLGNQYYDHVPDKTGEYTVKPRKTLYLIASFV